MSGHAEVLVLRVRRYRCVGCGVTMTVVPASVIGRRWYSGSSIALALYLWLVAGCSDREVRDRICVWKIRGDSSRGWAQLYRWSRHAAELFRGVSVGQDAVSVVRAVQSRSPPSLSDEEAAVFAGARLATR